MAKDLSVDHSSSSTFDNVSYFVRPSIFQDHIVYVLYRAYSLSHTFSTNISWIVLLLCSSSYSLSAFLFPSVLFLSPSTWSTITHVLTCIMPTHSDTWLTEADSWVTGLSRRRILSSFIQSKTAVCRFDCDFTAHDPAGLSTTVGTYGLNKLVLLLWKSALYDSDPLEVEVFRAFGL